MTKLEVGLDVDIQRTNGRIHSAVISAIDWPGKSVTVEWSEAEEIKGKEIDFESVYLLNPNLNESNTTTNSITNANHTIGQIPKRVIPTRPTNVSALNPPKGSLRVRQLNSRQTISNSNGITLEPIQSAPSSVSNGIPTSANSNNNNHHHSKVAAAKAAKEAVAAAAAAAAAAASAEAAAQTQGKGRKSNVVKEVDRIKKQREERRVRQANQKAEKQELINSVEPGNVNWEFLGMIRDYRSQIECKPITMSDPVDSFQICVAVRKRPMNKREMNKKDIDVTTVPTKQMIVVHEPKNKVDLTRYLENHMFRFDYAFDETSDNALVYKYTAKPLVHSIFEGGMATCFAYGQTGSGKTHTMGGEFHGKSQDATRGIYGLAATDVFKLLRSPKYRGEDLMLTASFFEIYSGKVFDLLNNKSKLRVLEDAKQQVQVVGLQERPVESPEDVIKLLQLGNNIRTSGVTSANNHSSRSHAVFQLILKRKSGGRMRGKLSLIDLAGNERGADTSSANRQTRMEGAEINKSLLALKECIRALGRKGAHLPFRASKLTQVLRDSFIGENSRTCMIAMISPGMQSCEHSLNTLRYADRVKELGAENPEVKNMEFSDEWNGQEDDLAMLHNSNSGELPDDLYTFHEAISHLQEMEEEILDHHKAFVDNIPRWADTHIKLLQMTSEVDYDVDYYVQKLDEVLDEKMDMLGKFKERVGTFRGQLAEEERMSKRMVK